MNKEDNIRISKAAVIIVLYQPQKTDIDKISLMADRYAGVIVDNSQESTFKQENVGLMHYIPLHENKGIAEAQNVGLQYIFNHTDATHIVFLDQDSDVPTTYVDDIIAAYNQIRQKFPNLAFLGPKTENKTTGKEYKSVFHKDKTVAPNFILKREVISSGGCTTREVMENVGMNESELFIDYVDLEWCWRAESKGFICGITPEITIQHMVGQDTIYIGGYTIIVSSPKRYFYQLRNYIWLLPRKYVPLQWKINKGIKNVARLIYFPFLIKSGFSCWKYMMKGIYAGLTQKKMTTMDKTSIYLSNARLTPSSYYRLTQYFSDTDASIHSSVPDSIYQWWHHKGKNGSHLNKVFLYAVYVFRTLWFLLKDMMVMRQGTVIVSRVIVPHHLPMIHQLLFKHLAHHNHIVWDFDDNILANKSCSPADFQFFSKYSNQIIVTNDFLQSLISPEYREKVMILPTTDGDMLAYDPTAYFEYRRYLFQKEIRLVWVATASGLEYIKAIIPALDKAAQKLTEGNTKELTLHIVCNKPLQAETTHLTIVNIPWSREVARQEMLHAHIGIMPLPDTPFTRGKGGFKLIQYMSVSMPVIGSDVGFNKQVVTNDIGFLIANDNEEEGWQRAIQALTVDWSTYLCYAKSAKARYDQFYSYQKNKDFWEKICKQ